MILEHSHHRQNDIIAPGASGDLHAVKKAYTELTHLLDNMIAGFEPSDDTTDLFAHLTNRPRSA